MPRNIEDYIRETVSINFFTIDIKPDIQYIVNRFTERNKGLLKKYFIILKNLWKYIAEIKKFILIIKRFEYILENLSLYIYRDTNFTNDLIICVSTGNHIVFLAGCLVIWKLKK